MTVQSPTAPLVSFVVPTLNRGRHVVRAVRSCLLAGERAGVQVEIIVVDSSSDDGSWEAMTVAFADDPRVILIQNDREAGPTGSWLLGARKVRGVFATFVWSDDYLAADFLTKLLPPLRDGSRLAIGRGQVRQLDDESPLGAEGARVRVEADVLLSCYLSDHMETAWLMPMSPACSLFAAEVMREWCESVVRLSQASALRKRLMWKAAIGPDFLLFLLALDRQSKYVVQELSPVAQFSTHEDSITVGSPPWLLRTGYWLARVAALTSGVGQHLSADQRRHVVFRLLVIGLRLMATTPSSPASGLSRRKAVLGLACECRDVTRLALRSDGRAPFIAGFLKFCRVMLVARLGGTGKPIRRGGPCPPDTRQT